MDRKMELINKIVENSINIYTVELDKVEDDKCIYINTIFYYFVN